PGHDDLDHGGDHGFRHFGKVRAVSAFRSNKSLGNDLDITDQVRLPDVVEWVDEAGAAIETARRMRNNGTGRPMARLVCTPSFCASVKRSHVETMPRMLSIPE